MKIGYPNNPRSDLKDDIRWISENGFDFIDLFLEPDKCSIENLNPYELRFILDNCRLGMIGHTPWYLPIGSPLTSLRNGAVEILKNHISFFSEIGCPKVTVHANWPPSMFTEAEGVEFQAESLQELVAYSRYAGIELMYEPVDTRFDHSGNIDRVLELVPGLSLHADVGHFNLYGRKPADYLAKYKGRISHIHFHDNDGFCDLHWPMGAGNIDWDGVLKTLTTFYDGTITLEIFSRDKAGILYSKHRLRNKWDAIVNAEKEVNKNDNPLPFPAQIAVR